jgi:purine catabolism regulator
MATLDDLRAAILPNARWLAAGPDRAPSTAATLDLAWIRLLRAGAAPLELLEPGDLAIVPRAAFPSAGGADDPRENGTPSSVVRGCVQAGAAGIVVIGSGPDPGNAPAIERELAIAASAGLPVLDAGAADPVAFERSAIGFLVNHRAELERQATLLETQLEHVALGGGGPDGLAAAIAGFLGRPVAIEGRAGTPVAVHVPPDVPWAAAAVAAYHRRRRSAAARDALPIPGDPGANSGALALLGDRVPSELERVATARVAGLVALELARDEAVGRAAEIARHEPLPADGPPWVVIVARQGTADGEVDEASPEGTRRETLRREALRREIRSLAPVRRLSLRGDVQSVVLRIVAAIDAADADGSGIGGQIGSLLGRIVAVSRPFDVISARSAAEADARSTLEAVEALADPPAVARADRLPAYRLLGHLHNLPDGPRQARALLAPLLRGRPDVRRERLATLRAVLDQPGLAEAADILGIHRNTVAYRVRRIEEATGWRLADPELRLPLALAVRLVQDD